MVLSFHYRNESYCMLTEYCKVSHRRTAHFTRQKQPVPVRFVCASARSFVVSHERVALSLSGCRFQLLVAVLAKFRYQATRDYAKYVTLEARRLISSPLPQ